MNDLLDDTKTPQISLLSEASAVLGAAANGRRRPYEAPAVTEDPCFVVLLSDPAPPASGSSNPGGDDGP